MAAMPQGRAPGAMTQAQVNEVGRRQMDAAIINEAIIITSSDNHPGDTCTDFSGG